MPKHKGAIKLKLCSHDGATGEWFFNDKWYDHYPAKEIKEYQDALDEHLERKHDERKERKP